MEGAESSLATEHPILGAKMLESTDTKAVQADSQSKQESIINANSDHSSQLLTQEPTQQQDQERSHSPAFAYQCRQNQRPKRDARS